jgi:hypothetical protein
MKIISKIAILTAFIACVSSCQKENIPVPTGSSPLENSANQRVSNPSATNTDPAVIITAKAKADTLDIVGGGDDDRDGGGDGKKVKKDR